MMCQTSHFAWSLTFSKMASVVKYIVMLAMFIQIAQSGAQVLGICQTGCNTLWVACVSAAGGVAGVFTGGAAIPAAILACNAAQGKCMAACITAGAAPTL